MGTTWLVVELDQPDLLLTSFTGQHPGCTIDVIKEPPVPHGDELLHPAIFMVKHAPWDAMATLQADLAQVYGPATTLRLDKANQVWVGRITMPQSAYHDAGAQAILKFQSHYGVAWVHLEQGVLHMRARIRDGVEPARLARQCQGFLEAHDVSAQVSLQEIPEHDFGLWRELVEYTVGLAP